MSSRVKLEDLGTAIAQTIAEYASDVKDAIDDVGKKVSDVAKKEVKQGAPVKSGDYKKSIRVKTEGQLLGNKKYTVYAAAPHYRLTHLLEHGHATRNGGRTRKFPHWAEAEKQAIEDYEKGVIKAIETGGKG